MKHLKTYEEVYSYTYDFDTDSPEIGDYVIMKTTSDNLKSFIQNNVGQISDFQIDDIEVTYSNIPDDIKEFMPLAKRLFHNKLIQYWSKDKEELEQILIQNKYNL